MVSKIIEKSFAKMNKFPSTSNQYGRENEVVKLFAHKFLLNNFDNSILKKAEQIGIEIAIKQIPKLHGKKLVRKDLVIQPNNFQTVWDDLKKAKNNPLAVIEWKVGDIKKCTNDIHGLKEFTLFNPEIITYSACAFLDNDRKVVYRKIINSNIVTLALK